MTDASGRVVLAGYTNGVWEGSEPNVGSNDFVAAVLDTLQLVSSQENNPAVDSTLITAVAVAIVVAVGALAVAAIWKRRKQRAKTNVKVDPASNAPGIDNAEYAPSRSREQDDGNASGASSNDFGESVHPPLSISGRVASSGGIGIAEAMIEAAAELAGSCPVPGVSEAATLVSLLTKLVSDSRDNSASNNTSLRSCQSIMVMLNSAAEVLGQVYVFFLKPE